ncbi:beta-galactosidase [Sulfitobacter sp. S190]|uniref:beta-galactosidase n=1 Tax=Sulfitobacter sp. S190 TaxID=2867022 RepID=UPI0021A95B4E|nr:beta-galactosidase [Sulfitobacter sp. S190]UWR24463.1 beta-galactosidase [Sulfitobacter sp. S190]UWR24485.1 beta-galactosidase [Sulfitobacter sp. S190]
MNLKRTLGTCYYPEHWDRAIWEDDARRMAEAGLTWVRIGEFAWTRLEPAEGDYHLGWLDDAIAVLGSAGLKVVLGTPTATPPRWIMDKHPDMIALDELGRPRRFGSRRHYCFSHEGYKAECARIVSKLAERYGDNPHIAAWQTDNEYGCHDTTLSYSDAAGTAFQSWLRTRYPGAGNGGDINALNDAWGNVFWSMDYDDFDQIGLPNLTVTEPNPAHSLAFRRFTSDQVVAFNRVQVDIIRRHSDAPITHNYMGRITDFDHFDVGNDLDFASWDSYPLGFLEDRSGFDDAHKKRFARQGDPDFGAFHHDLYRAVGKGRWWVMEQQPGPVNWAPYNPAPLPGMVRLWSWEAFAHGAEAVCYFRWRQAPFAQEQMHAGLLRPDSADAPGMAEAQQVAQELGKAPDVQPVQAPVALMFDYAADYYWAVQPHGDGLSYFGLVFDTYRALRAMGLSVDIVPASTRDFSGYTMILAPGVMHMEDDLKQAFARADATVLVGPRTGARDADMCTPVPMPPAWPDFDATVTYVQSIRPDSPVALPEGGHFIRYLEHIETGETVVEATQDGAPALVQKGRFHYLAGWPDQDAARRILGELATSAGLSVMDLPDGVRCRDTGTERFWFNFDTQSHTVAGRTLAPVSVLRETL